MLDDSLLEPTDSEQEDSSCSYTEEEIQQILADDDLEPEPYTSGKFAVVNLNVGGENMETIKRLLQHLKAFSSASNPDPPKSTEGGLLENIGSQTEDLGQESSVSELTDNLKLNTVISSQSCGEDTPSGKKLGKVLPVPQMETRLRRRLYTSETELEQRKRIYIRCVQAHVRTPRDTTQGTLEEWYALLSNVASKNGNHDQSWKYTLDLTMRNYPRFSKKPTQKYSLDQWVNKNSANYHRFQSIPDRFQRSPVTGSSNE
ncbi:S100P-binding protein [Alligator mississippiensis]|uniref:S100P-binding protein n=1 Tax=Alligator mississippiensis TaxID=8496 RepID=A0A151MMS3_ALLMI|nr:S100P-binding protein [Alligator mississippiensis]